MTIGPLQVVFFCFGKPRRASTRLLWKASTRKWKLHRNEVLLRPLVCWHGQFKAGCTSSNFPSMCMFLHYFVQLPFRTVTDISGESPDGITSILNSNNTKELCTASTPLAGVTTFTSGGLKSASENIHKMKFTLLAQPISKFELNLKYDSKSTSHVVSDVRL